MLVVLSPAKTLDFETPFAFPELTAELSQPALLAESQQLIDVCRELAPQDIASLMKVSDKIAALNFERFQAWQTPFTPDNAKAALLAFKGDVYTGLDAGTLNADQLRYAQQHLRLLSGLYGVLRPLDLMQPYRLEMGKKLANPRGKDLYQFWGETISEQLNQAQADDPVQILVNLASNEYFKSVKPAKLNARVVTPVFKDFKNGQYKIISFYAKKARGMMARFIIQEQLSDVEQLSGFNAGGYYYDEQSSTPDTLVFLRDQPA